MYQYGHFTGGSVITIYLVEGDVMELGISENSCGASLRLYSIISCRGSIKFHKIIRNYIMQILRNTFGHDYRQPAKLKQVIMTECITQDFTM